LLRRPICKLPGAFNNFMQELFTPKMLLAQQQRVLTPTPDPATGATASQPSLDGCGMTEEIEVLDYNPGVASQPATPDAPPIDPSQRYCRPDGFGLLPESLTKITTWKLPPRDPSEQIEYRWEGSTAFSPDQIPVCNDQMIAMAGVSATLPTPGAIQLPDLRGLGENQAKEQLALLGITSTYVDYQGRDRIPAVFDTVAPYVVVSTLPAPGAWVPPDTTVVLGIRAP
jgi:peptidoglycan glycosyltransferase